MGGCKRRVPRGVGRSRGRARLRRQRRPDVWSPQVSWELTALRPPGSGNQERGFTDALPQQNPARTETWGMAPRGGAGRGARFQEARPHSPPEARLSERIRRETRGWGEEGGTCWRPLDSQCPPRSLQVREKRAAGDLRRWPLRTEANFARGGRGRGWGPGDALPGHRSAVSASRSPSGGARPGVGMLSLIHISEPTRPKR